MTRSRNYLIKRVQVRVNEVVPVGTNVGGSSAIEDPISAIDDELDDSAEYILRTAPLPVLYSAIQSDKKHFHGTSVQDVDTRVSIDSDKIAIVVCPDNFLRLVSIKLSGWKKAIQSVMDPRDSRYKLQHNNKYTSGSYDKPSGALISFSDYSTIEITIDTANGTLVYGETITGGTSGATAKVLYATSTKVIANTVTGTFQTSETITGGTSGATGNTTALDLIKVEKNKWVIDRTLSTAQTLSNLDAGFDPSDGNGPLVQGDIIILNAQADGNEDGIYLINTDGTAPTQLSKDTSIHLPYTALELYRAKTLTDTIDHFHYIPRLKADEMPNELIDALIFHCSGRVLEYMGDINEASVMYQKADSLIGNIQTGIN